MNPCWFFTQHTPSGGNNQVAPTAAVV